MFPIRDDNPHFPTPLVTLGIGGFAAGALLTPLFKNPRLLARHPYHGWRQKGLPTRSWQRLR